MLRHWYQKLRKAWGLASPENPTPGPTPARRLELIAEAVRRAHLSPTPRDNFAATKIVATCALRSGCPAWWLQFGDGSYLHGMDEKTGLPVRLAGDRVDDALSRQVAGHNAAVRAFINEHGLPWNSRLPWLREVYAPGTYFDRAAARSAPYRLEVGGPFISSPDGATEIGLVGEQRETGEKSSLILRSTRICPELPIRLPFPFHPIFAAQADQIFPRLPALPKRGHDWSQTPVERTVSLWTYEPYRDKEFVWGPKGSELIFFRFRNHRWLEEEKASLPPGDHEGLKETFAVFDLTLPAWLRNARLNVPAQ
ncbi:MAG: hypothetical protein QOE70_6276 [Chthoniobacter sp.]|jgi:hypothetical protein|nr:hypothetical protein [Chthoniobacter sp.]